MTRRSSTDQTKILRIGATGTKLIIKMSDLLYVNNFDVNILLVLNCVRIIDVKFPHREKNLLGGKTTESVMTGRLSLN